MKTKRKDKINLGCGTHTLCHFFRLRVFYSGGLCLPEMIEVSGPAVIDRRYKIQTESPPCF